MPEVGEAGFEFVFFDEALCITIYQPCQPLSALSQLGFNGALLLPFRSRGRVQAAAIFLREPLGVIKQATHFTPHREVQEIGSDLRIFTNPLAPKPIGIRAETSIVCIGPLMPFGGFPAHGFPVQRVATLLTLDQALQQIARPPLGLAGMALVDLELRLDRRKEDWLHHRGHGNGNPLLGGHITDRHRPSRVHWAPPLRAQTGPQGPQTGLPKGGGPLLGRILQDAPHHTAIPDSFSSPGHFAGLGQTPTDLANAQAFTADPRKDLADHPGFLEDNVIAGLPTPRMLVDVAIALRGPAEDIHHPRSRRMPLPSAMPFDNLGALIFRHHPLHLEQQIVFWAPPELTI